MGVKHIPRITSTIDGDPVGLSSSGPGVSKAIRVIITRVTTLKILPTQVSSHLKLCRLLKRSSDGNNAPKVFKEAGNISRGGGGEVGG